MHRDKISFGDLIGKPFQENGRGPASYDCYGLVIEVMRRFGIDLPDYNLLCSGHDPKDIEAAVEAASAEWEKIDGPEIGSLVTIAYPFPGSVSHVGVVIDMDRFIHARQATGGVSIDRLSSAAWNKRIRGYYRYIGPSSDRGGRVGSPFFSPIELPADPTLFPAGTSIGEIIRSRFPYLSPSTCIVICNGRLNPDWARAVNDGDHIMIMPRIRGGNIGRTIGSIVVTIAAVVATVYTYGAAGGAAAGWVAAAWGAAAWGAAAGTAVSLAGSMVVNSLFPPLDVNASLPAISETSSFGSGSMGGSTTYAWGGPKNSWSPELAIPILYGKMRCGGQIINYYLETNNNTDNQTLYMLIAICEGEATPPASADEIYIGDDKLVTYDAYQYDTRGGTGDQTVIAGFEKLHQYRDLSIKVEARTLLSVHFDSDVVSDASPFARTLINSGGVTLDTTNKKFGAGSAAFDGTASAQLYLASSDFDMYSRDFGAAIQWLPSLVAGTRYYGLLSYCSTTAGWCLFYDKDNDIIAFNVLGSWAFNTNPLMATYGIDFFDDEFHHIEINRWGNYWGIWVDGKQAGYKVTDAALPAVASGQYLRLGHAYVDTGWRPCKGNIDATRIIQNYYLHKPGVERGGIYYPLDFTPPTEAYNDDYDFVVATRGDCDEIAVMIEFPRGLYEVTSGSELIDHSCEFGIYYRAVGGGAWTHLADYTVTAHQREPVRRQYSITGLARGRYEVRLARISAEETSTLKMSDLYWTGLDEVLDEALAHPHIALLGLIIDGSERLNNEPPTVSSIWDRGTISVRGAISEGAFVDAGSMSIASSNPAWAAYDMLTHERYGYHIAPSRIDYASWRAWADWCAGTVDGATRITLNGILDSQMLLASALNKVCQHGRARIVQAGQTIRVAIEAPVSTPVQVFGAANIVEDSATTEFLPRANRPDIYYIEYNNAAHDYRKDKIPIKSGGYDSLTRVPVTENVFLWGCTSDDEARRYGLLRMQISDRLNRQRSWRADVDAIACLPGDVVVSQDEGNELTYGGRLADQTGVDDAVIVLDQLITLDAATYSGNCTIWVRLADDSLEIGSITGPWDVETDTFTLAAAMSGKGIEDVFVIGHSVDAGMKYRVTSISRDVDSLFELAALEYDESVYYHSDYGGGETPI